MSHNNEAKVTQQFLYTSSDFYNIFSQFVSDAVYSSNVII